jgi:hypothetical protein
MLPELGKYLEVVHRSSVAAEEHRTGLAVERHKVVLGRAVVRHKVVEVVRRTDLAAVDRMVALEEEHHIDLVVALLVVGKN